MSMKKTDLEKQLAKKLDGRLKSGTAPQRFGKASAAAGAAGDAGGSSAVMAEAARHWLAAQGPAASP